MRRVDIAGMTPNPDGAWMAQMARNMSMVFAEEPAEFRPTHIIRDRDSKFTTQFCSILQTDGIEFRSIPPRSPNLNPFAEAWVQRTKHEVLNYSIVFGENHLRHILACWLTYSHRFRPHQGLGNVPLGCNAPVREEVTIADDSRPPGPLEDFRLDDIICHESLGGLPRHYERRAA